MKHKSIKSRLLASSLMVFGVAVSTPTTFAQDSEDEARQETVTVTGTRIQQPGIVSSSPIASLGMEDFELNQTVEVEQLFRDLPIALPGDNPGVNNGTAGATTLNLRGLGDQRTLVLVDGKRMVPFDVGGAVDVSAIPVLMLDRIDVVTGGASAVYGSDAMAGAVNFVTRSDFAGFEVDAKYTESAQGDGEVYNISTIFGSNFDEDRGNVTLALSHTDRKGVLLGQREFGEFGISTRNGPAAGGVPAAPDPNCAGPNTTASETGVGSTTSIPTALDLPGGTLQFLNDGTTSARCSRFNFSPFNYFQTPQQRFVGMATGRYEINENIEAYTRANFTAINVRQQVAPSGVFGNVFEIPLLNPFLSDQARQDIIDNVNGALDPAGGFGLAEAGVNDLNGNGIFDLADSIDVPVRRRTLELGTRSTNYDTNNFQFVTGLRGDLVAGWEYDVSYSYAEAERTNVSAGYTNVSNIALALNTVSADTCTTPGGDTTDGCVPIDLFSTGFGSITPEAAAFNSATALDKREYTQSIFQATTFGDLPFTLPAANSPIAAAVGFEYREEEGSTEPDECLKEPPSSCLGGAGGNQLPVGAGFDVYELFAESFVPIAQGRQGFEDLQLELGFRWSDYSTFGSNETWKAGINWEITPGFRARIMQQQAVRAPNISEIGSPVTLGLEDASFDPCSNGNPDPISAELAALCVSTGVLPARVGLVNDIVSNQVSVFEGTDQANLPEPETADTLTAGVVWQAPSYGPMTNAVVTLDYFDIEIKDVIDEFSPQEILDNCYILGDPTECAKINRVGGTLSTVGAGIDLFTTNLDFERTEGIDFNVATDWDLGEQGSLDVNFVMTYLLTQESQSSATAPLIDCLGKFGNDCQPTPELRFNTRGTWRRGPATASLQWRYIGEVDIQDSQRAGTFDGFEQIDAINYFDLSGSYAINDTVTVSANIRNLLDEEPPLVGNGAGSTARNSGNTFPGTYDTIGRTYTVGLRATF